MLPYGRLSAEGQVYPRGANVGRKLSQGGQVSSQWHQTSHVHMVARFLAICAAGYSVADLFASSPIMGST
jgi:hypothetical protein